jgi:hypothetical protein
MALCEQRKQMSPIRDEEMEVMVTQVVSPIAMQSRRGRQPSKTACVAMGETTCVAMTSVSSP